VLVDECPHLVADGEHLRVVHQPRSGPGRFEHVAGQQLIRRDVAGPAVSRRTRAAQHDRHQADERGL
jgi:hypothetical protein